MGSEQKICGSILMILVITMAHSMPVRAKEAGGKHPVYVGAKVCATCHQGNQFSRWLASKHARAYAVLAKPEARRIAELSGIPQEPQESPMCLGCHATGARSPDSPQDAAMSGL